MTWRVIESRHYQVSKNSLVLNLTYDLFEFVEFIWGFRLGNLGMI